MAAIRTSLNLNVGRCLLLLDNHIFEGEQVNVIKLHIVTLHVYTGNILVDIVAFISFTKNRHQGLLLKYILECQVVKDGEGKLKGQLESFKLVTLVYSVLQNGRGIAEQI